MQIRDLIDRLLDLLERHGNCDVLCADAAIPDGEEPQLRVVAPNQRLALAKIVLATGPGLIANMAGAGRMAATSVEISDEMRERLAANGLSIERENEPR